MSKNSSPSLLDAPQIVKRVYDEANDSVRVNLGDVNGLSFNISSTGDSILAVGTTDGTTSGTQKVIKLGADGTVQISGTYTYTPAGSSTKASLTSASSGTVLGPVSCVGMKSFNLYTNTTSTITGAQALTVQVSPSDTDNVWINTTLTATESTVNGTVIAGTNNTSITGRRVQVVIAAPISTGTFDAYLVMNGV
jgi:hypothetical protein